MPYPRLGDPSDPTAMTPGIIDTSGATVDDGLPLTTIGPETVGPVAQPLPDLGVTVPSTAPPGWLVALLVLGGIAAASRRGRGTVSWD